MAGRFTRRAFILASALLAGATLVRWGRADGPGDTAATVRAATLEVAWRTDLACTAWVEYGAAGLPTRATAEEARATKQHRAILPDLGGGARYDARLCHRAGGVVAVATGYVVETPALVLAAA